MGAGAQMAQIIDGKPARIIYVSCNPQALTRDTAGLKAAGYQLDGVTVIDQFLWSTEVEAVFASSAPRPPHAAARDKPHGASSFQAAPETRIAHQKIRPRSPQPEAIRA
jgi:hypothetical protein